MSKRTTITTLASYYGLPVEDVKRVAMAEGINDDNYNITGETKRRIHAKLESLQQKQSKGTSGIPTKAKGGELDALKRELSRRNERIRSLEDEVVVKDSKIRELSDESSSYRSQAKRLREEAFAREAQVRDALALRSRMAELETKNAELEGRVQALREQNESLSRKLSNEKLVAKQEAQQYERDRASFKVQLESDRAAIEHAYRDLNAVAVESVQKDMECANLSSWLSDALDEAYQLKVSNGGITTLRYWMYQQNNPIAADDSQAARIARDYLARVLHRRFEEAASVIFGSYKHPNQFFLSCDRADKLKGLGFGNDKHPDCYADEDCAAYYCLRYEMEYAFEYFVVYLHLLNDMGELSQPLEIASLGAGQGLDLWGLMYALTRLNKCRGLNLPIRWTGVDREAWPNKIIDQAWGIYYIQDDIKNYLKTLDGRIPQVLMFPKSICELSPTDITDICNWIINAKLTMRSHYIVIVHTDRRSLDKTQHGNQSEDSYKANRIIEAFINLGQKNDYSPLIPQGCLPFDDPYLFPKDKTQDWFGDVAVEWSGNSVRCKHEVGVQFREPAFVPFGKNGKYRSVFNMVKQLYVCCEMNRDRLGIAKHLVAERGEPCCNKPGCHLHKYPRTRLDNMAYHIVRIEDDIPF
jgi:predicted  nucleic acid-binding Zn-ribbon protein